MQQTHSEPEASYLTLKAAAEHAGLSPTTLRDASTRGELEIVLGERSNRLWVSKASLDAWLTRREIARTRSKPGCHLHLVVDNGPRK